MKRILAAGLVLCFSACASIAALEIRPAGENRGWAVYRRGYLIPEYTATRDGVYAADQKTAEILYGLRKEGLEPYLLAKYDLIAPSGPANIPVVREKWRNNEQIKADMEHYLLKTEIEFNAIQSSEKLSKKNDQ